MDDSKFHSSVNESDAESDREIETDEECFFETFLDESSDLKVQDITLDPKIQVSDHEDDQELSMQGYKSCDTDEESEGNHNAVSNRLVDQDSWCKCGNCGVLGTEIECYCCQESTHISDLILDNEKIKCVTDCELFSTGICNQKVLQMCSFGMMQKNIPLDSDGNIKPDGLRYAAYRNFLNICELRYIGKNRRYVLPACAIMKIRSLYPSVNGRYRSFKASEFVSRI